MEVVAELIARSRTKEESDAFRAFVPTDAQIKLLADVGLEVLEHFPSVPGCCALMNAQYAAHLQERTDAPVYMAAGALYVGSLPIFGQAVQGESWQSVFQRSNPSWDGHCWLVFGNRIADVSIFRTAYSGWSHPALLRHVLDVFGKGRGLLICGATEAASQGLDYKPQYILTEDEITALCGGSADWIGPFLQRGNEQKASPRGQRGNTPRRTQAAPSAQMRGGSVRAPQLGRVGRNDLCPCGSGKKFKQCCLQKG
jgi:hypothetical protein